MLSRSAFRQRPAPVSRAALLAPAALLVCAELLSARPCSADRCAVRLTGPLSDSWFVAARRLEARVTATEDCGRVEVEVRGDGALLVFVTRDGRRAERPLAHPDELEPTVLALGVRGPHEAAPAAGAEARTPAAPAPPASGVGAPLDVGSALPARPPGEAEGAQPSELEPRGPYEARAVFSLLGGTRAGTGRLISSAFAGSAAIELDRWELGVNLVIEGQYVELHSRGPRAPSSAVCVGVSVGRREPLADVDVRLGVSAMVAALNDESERDSGERGLAEIRLGSYVGGVWPRHASTRLRADLALDVVPHRVLGSLGTRITPWLAASVLLGVEFGGP
jgi:hypothetical protein